MQQALVETMRFDTEEVNEISIDFDLLQKSSVLLLVYYFVLTKTIRVKTKEYISIYFPLQKFILINKQGIY